MADTVSKKKRSEIMSRIHGGLKNNGLERAVHGWFKGSHVRHRMYPKVAGNPDAAVLTGSDTVYVFIDGCFWHCCPKHYRRPKTNKRFWVPHVEESNRRREDLRKTLEYRWVRIWEHEIRDGTYKQKLLNFIREQTSFQSSI